jgi:hypothetical protein
MVMEEEGSIYLHARKILQQSYPKELKSSIYATEIISATTIGFRYIVLRIICVIVGAEHRKLGIMPSSKIVTPEPSNHYNGIVES